MFPLGDNRFPLFSLPYDLIEHAFSFVSSGALLVSSKKCHHIAKSHRSLNYAEFLRLVEQLFQIIRPRARVEHFGQMLPLLKGRLMRKMKDYLVKNFAIESIDFRGLPKTRSRTGVPLCLIVGLPIHSLHLRNVPTTAEELQLLSSSKHLTSLKLCGYPHIDKPFLLHLSEKAFSLTSLHLNNCQSVTDDGLFCVEFPNLTSLSLVSCRLIRGMFLAHFSKLLILNLRFTQVSDEGLFLLQSDLCELDLTECPEVTDSGVRAVSRAAPHLHTLKLFNCSKVTFCGLSRFFPHLLDLDLGFCRVQKGIIGELAASCTLLRRLALGGVVITEVEAFNFSKLQVLDIGATALKLEEAEFLLGQCPQLLNVEVHPEKSAAAVLRRMPQTKREVVIG